MVQENNLKKVIAICGPTASGKSGLAIKLAQDLDGEIVSCDSIQIYKDLDIGSAKVTKQEQNIVPHHLIDILQPNQEFSCSEFSRLALIEIESILKRGKQPILCGGTGLFLKGLIDGYDFSSCSKNVSIRKKYQTILEEKGSQFLFDLLCKKNPQRARELNSNDSKRIIRALEILDCGAKIATKKQRDDYKFILICLDNQREILYERINERVDEMVKNGLFNEVESLLKRYNLTENNQSMKGIGYKEVIQYYNGVFDKQTCIDLIKQHTRNYAKRQLTWFRHMEDINWFKPNEYLKILELCKNGK